MKILKRLKDIHSLKRRIEELVTSLRSKDEMIRKLEEENASLQLRIKELVLEYRDVDSKVAGMNYRLYELTRENKILTMNLTGARAQRDGMLSWIEKIKEKYGRENV